MYHDNTRGTNLNVGDRISVGSLYISLHYNRHWLVQEFCVENETLNSLLVHVVHGYYPVQKIKTLHAVHCFVIEALTVQQLDLWWCYILIVQNAFPFYFRHNLKYDIPVKLSTWTGILKSKSIYPILVANRSFAALIVILNVCIFGKKITFIEARFAFFFLLGWMLYKDQVISSAPS